MINALGPLGSTNLGLQCAVDGDCSSANFTDCSPATITLETERSYEVSVRYSEVPGSCETTRITRDLTPPGFERQLVAAVRSAWAHDAHSEHHRR